MRPHNFTCHSTYILLVPFYRSTSIDQCCLAFCPFRTKKNYAKRLNEQTKCHEMQSKLKKFMVSYVSWNMRSNKYRHIVTVAIRTENSHSILQKKNFKIWDIVCVFRPFILLYYIVYRINLNKLVYRIKLVCVCFGSPIS